MRLPKLHEIDWKRTALMIITIIAVASATWNWYHPRTQAVTRTVYQPAPQERVVEKIRKVEVPGPARIITIEKKAVAEKLDMPWLMDGEHGPAPVTGKADELQVTANADIPPTKGGVSTVAVTNTTTGETTIIAKEKPLPLFGFPSEKELGLRYGLRSHGLQGGTLYGRWTFFRMGDFHLSGYGEIDTRPEGKLMAEISYRW